MYLSVLGVHIILTSIGDVLTFSGDILAAISVYLPPLHTSLFKNVIILWRSCSGMNKNDESSCLIQMPFTLAQALYRGCLCN